jgi:hypothetical protein
MLGRLIASFLATCRFNYRFAFLGGLGVLDGSIIVLVFLALWRPGG